MIDWAYHSSLQQPKDLGSHVASCLQMNSDSKSNVSIRESIFEAAQTLHQAGISDSRREAGSLLQYVIDRDRTFIISHAEDLITEEQWQSFRNCVQRRATGEPLQYITCRQAFYGLDFEVNRDVLIPRPETELLVETAASLLEGVTSPPFVCDVGTGSGCIAVALLDSNQRASAIALDVSEAAIQVARRNALRHSVKDRVAFVVADCFRAMRAGERFDLVISNPPYVAGVALDGLQREVRDHEPRVALTPGPDGLSIIRRLLSESAEFLKPGGYLLVEIGFDQGDAVSRLINQSTWKLLEIQPDLQGIPRVLALQKIVS